MKMKAANRSRAQKSFAVVKLTRLLPHTRARVEISRAHSNKKLSLTKNEKLFFYRRTPWNIYREIRLKNWFTAEWNGDLYCVETVRLSHSRVQNWLHQFLACVSMIYSSKSLEFFCCCCLLSSHNSHFHNSNAALAELSYLKSEFQGACLTQFRDYRFDCASCYNAHTSSEDHHHHRSCRIMRNVKLPPNQISIIISVWQQKNDKRSLMFAMCFAIISSTYLQHSFERSKLWEELSYTIK